MLEIGTIRVLPWYKSLLFGWLTYSDRGYRVSLGTSRDSVQSVDEQLTAALSCLLQSDFHLRGTLQLGRQVSIILGID